MSAASVLAVVALFAGFAAVMVAIMQPLVPTLLFMGGLVVMLAGMLWLFRGVDVLADHPDERE